MIDKDTQDRLDRLEDAAQWALQFIKAQAAASGKTQVLRMIRVKLETALQGGAAYSASTEIAQQWTP